MKKIYIIFIILLILSSSVFSLSLFGDKKIFVTDTIGGVSKGWVINFTNSINFSNYNFTLLNISYYYNQTFNQSFYYNTTINQTINETNNNYYTTNTYFYYNFTYNITNNLTNNITINNTFYVNYTYNITNNITTNMSANDIKALGFNLTSELKAWFDTLYQAIGAYSTITQVNGWISSNSTADRQYCDLNINNNRTNLITLFSNNDSALLNQISSIGNWSNDKPNYWNSSLLLNGTLALNNTLSSLPYIATGTKLGNTSAEIFAVANNGSFVTAGTKLGNTSAEIKSMGFNFTTELKTYFDTIYFALTGKVGNTTQEIFNVVNNGTLALNITLSSLPYISTGTKLGNTTPEIWSVANNGTLALNTTFSKYIDYTNTSWITANQGYNTSQQMFNAVNNGTLALNTTFSNYPTKTDLTNNITSANTSMKNYVDTRRFTANLTYANFTNVSTNTIVFNLGGKIWDNGTHICIGSC